MNCTEFIKGMGIGLAVGVTAGSMMPGKHWMRRRRIAMKAVRAASHVVDGIESALR